MPPKLRAIMILTVSFLSALSTHSTATPFTIDGSTVYVNAGFVGVRTSTPITVLDVNGDAQFGSGFTKSTFSATGSLTLASGSSFVGSSATFNGTSGPYDLTLSTGIYISAGEIFLNSGSGGIRWPDGSRSTTAATSGGTSAVSGTWSTVSSTTFSSSSTITLGTIVSSNTYQLICNVIPKTTAGYIHMRVDGANSGANYLWQQDLTANGTVTSGGGTSATSCMVSYNTGAYFPNTDDPYHFEAQFGAWNQGQKKVDITIIGAYAATSGDRVTHRDQCFYSNGVGSIADITIILNGGGTLSGDCRLALLNK